MNHLKTVLTSAALALAFAIPSANAQNASERGVVDCGVKLATCLASGGNVLTCGIEFAQCLAAGSAAPAERREN